MRRLTALGATVAVSVAAVSLVAIGPASADHANSAQAVLRDAEGKRVGTVNFEKEGNHVLVTADLVPNANVTRGTFHGFHIHANNDDTATVGKGKGCQASGTDKTQWVLSADGHYTEGGQSHGTHAGDMPSVLVRENGKAYLSFDTDRIKVKDLVGKAVMLHAGPDNFGNVPVGDKPDQYTANGPEATTKTSKTGNAGDRVACGLIKKS